MKRKFKSSDFSDLISTLRRESGYTYEQLSDLSGVSKSTIHNIEQGSSTRIEVFEKLIDAFGMVIILEEV